MSDARRRAEEWLAKSDALLASEDLHARGSLRIYMQPLAEALRALLAEEPGAANVIRCAIPRGECCHQRIPAVLPLEAPECNDGDDCCRYCGRGLQPCGACKAPPPADAATEALPEEAEAILHAVAERDCRCGLWIEPVFCESCRARAFLAARRGDV